MDVTTFLDKIEEAPSEGGVKIKYKGKFLKLESGKHIWSEERFAKSALRNHCYYFLADSAWKLYETETYSKRDAFKNAMWNEILKEVEFVKL